MRNKILITITLLLNSVLLFAQTDRKVNFIGGARSLLNTNTLVVNDSLPDTVSVKKNNGGYAIMD